VVPAQPEVIIIGGGPVGVGLALQLGLGGTPCALIERRTALSGGIPKGQNLTQRTLEHFYFWGVADEIRAARAMPPGFPIGEVTVYENLMGEFWSSPPGREAVGAYYFQANERLPQYRTEEVLRRRLAGLGNVATYFGWTATGIQQDEGGVRVVIERDGAVETLEAPYAAGCDGGRSLVREAADIPRHGSDFDELMVLLVFRSRQLHEALRRFPDRSVFRVLHPGLKGYWMFFGRIDVGEGFFFHAPVPAGSTAGNLDVRKLLSEAAGFDVHAEIDHVSFWDLRVQVAETYRSKRVFIAGDAAHTHPPYGGFGVNNGLEDAVNLGWKLTAVLGGWGGEALLDSYSLERRPVFRDIGEDIIAATIKEEARFLERYSPKRDRAEFELAFAQTIAATARRMRSLNPHYAGSPVVCAPPGSITSAHGVHSFAARAGYHLPPQPLSSGRNVFEELGRGFTLLAFDAADGEAGRFEDAARSFGIPLRVVRDTVSGGREAYGSRLILVRPDQHVAWAGDTAPADPERVMCLVTGQ
jgi:2-polyprenyl-6-methoxyphenol hydroxylase-like FAD-dependent oxidoreductase